MALDLGRDFWCAYRGVWVAESEFNGKSVTYCHEPKNDTPYIAGSQGKCQCLTCPETDKTACKKCNNPDWLRFEHMKVYLRNADRIGNVTGRLADLTPRCILCMVQYKIHGKLK